MPSPIDVCFLTISSILFLMYVIFLISLLAYRSTAPLRSGFFTLTFILGVFDVLQMAHVYIFLRFPSFGWFTDEIYLQLPTWLVHYASCAMWALAVNQHLTVLFIALNRLSAIVFPHEHKRRWRESVIRVITVIICCSGPIYVSPKIFLQSVERYKITDNRSRSATIVWDNQDLLLTFKYSAAITLSIASLICFLSYVSIFYTSIQRHIMSAKRRATLLTKRRSSSSATVLTAASAGRRKSSGAVSKSSKGSFDFKPSHVHAVSIRNLAKKVSIRAQTKSTQVVILWEKRELKLAVCGFIIFTFMFIYTVGVCNMSVDDSARQQAAHRSIWMASSDLFSGINPLLLIIVSKSLRSRFLAVLCCNWNERQYSPQPSTSF
uniref:G-protein coupled receptors family 1 profile domain-containing protein n=1 Tax=Panagrolaimus superbus TaxID=310955 RepID=A0A914Y5W1_9BILA